MKSTTFALPILSLLAAAQAFSLFTESDTADVNNKGLTSYHEGAGINYAFLGADSIDFEYDATAKSLSQKVGGYSYNFSVTETHAVQFSVIEGAEVSFDGEYLSYKGSTSGFYACKDIVEPYEYSKSTFAVTYFGSETPSYTDCAAIKIKKVGGSTSSSSSSSAHHSATSSAHYGNHTVTDYETITGYTTYCPVSTTITITTCGDNKCGPKTITVDEPKTLTITESCVVPKTTAPVTTAGPTTAIHSTTTSSVAPKVTSYEGNAAKNVVGGLAGAAAFAALLI